MKWAKQKITQMQKAWRFKCIQRLKIVLLTLRHISNRAIKIKVNIHGKASVSMINAYTPTFSAEDEKVE